MDEKDRSLQASEKADLERDSENPHGRDIDSSRERALVWKQDLRILPLCAAIYLLCYLDRSNIGRLQAYAVFFTKSDNSIALMVFLIAYALFEVPSNYFLKKLKPSKWIAFLMLGWGASTMGLGGAHNYAQVTGIRFLLGVMEAGLFPGLVYFLTFWYRNSERSMRVALILASATLAGAFGGAIAYGVGHMNQTHGLSAWRWLFIIEGAPSCASAFLVWFFLPDYPETASWLNAEEKEFAMQRLQNEGSKGAAHAMTWADAKEILTDWRLYAHYLIYFGISTPFSSLSLFTPAITSGLGYTSLRAQLMTVPPWAAAYVVTTAAAWSADHFNRYAMYIPRRGRFTAFSFIGAMGFLASAVLPPEAYLHRYGCLIVATSGSFACIPPLLGWLSSNLRSTAGTGLAIALNVSVGAPGQIVGVWIYKANEAKRGYPTGHWTNAALLLFVCVGCLLLRVYYGWLNKRRGTGDKFAY
ncbi:major facilitator superfamily domain-containing protein [Aspergillus bertholletiae]|uniref:Major facilitator superfamily domain-containing protein n=1 Tax=Aspergillus bertholletiae TaxID=1226010 RepID=A0A5N7ATP4_9EURO|nr:major facilitator superfamily domain-containing protein [Aspergillus bertholletiae]